MTKISFSAVKGNIEITIGFFCDEPEFVYLLAWYVITTYATHQKMFHVPSILNSDSLYDKYAEKN